MADLSKTKAGAALASHAASLADQPIKDLFAADPDRMAWSRASAAGLTLDFSKQQVTQETLAGLMALAREQGFEDQRARLFSGEAVNTSEGRPALHMALRDGLPGGGAASVPDISKVVSAARDEMIAFAQAVRKGVVRAPGGKPFQRVVHIGIGGSELGPRLAAEALRPFIQAREAPRFVANIDAAEFLGAVAGADPSTTLFIVVSKTFATQETLENAKLARSWLQASLPKNHDPAAHFVAVTANPGAAKDFGIPDERVFAFWDWVGGRYSVWSSVGLALAIAIGQKNFEAFLAGAAAMDRHFVDAPLDQNLPVLLALLGIWNRNFLGLGSHAVLPYSQSLALLPSYLQQLEMESNGKSVHHDGTAAAAATTPAVWGGAGTTGQHAFFQWLHQGTSRAACDIILPLTAHHAHGHHQDILVSHAIAQGEALAFGRDAAATREELVAEGLDKAELERLLPHRTFAGNRPVSTLLMDRLAPDTLGALLALYEHKVFTQAVLWDINPFDQWGVELGKKVAGRVLGAVTEQAGLEAFDPSTRKLIEAARKARSSKKSET